MSRKNTSKLNHPLFLILGIMFIASTLRAPITGVSPILDFISKDLALSPTLAGFITTLPLIAFAVFSPISSGVARKVGLEPALMFALMTISFGIVLRSLGSVTMLYSGTLLIGIGIAFGNVLLPSLLKRDFPNKVATLTSMYVLMMGVASTISASAAYPIVDWATKLHIDQIPRWGLSLASVLIFPVLAIVLWLPQVRQQTRPTADTIKLEGHHYLWHTLSAWQVTTYLALNSFMMYTLICWLPNILLEKGYSESEAGFLHGMLQLATAIPALVLIPLMARMKDKRGLSSMISACAVLGLVGLMLLPQLAVVWIIAIGFSLGGGFILSLSFVGLRTHDAHQAAALSGMAQCVGYLFAATGPIVFGFLHESFHSWQEPLIFLFAISLLWTSIAFIAGKPQMINTR